MGIAKLLATSVTMAALVQAWNRVLAPTLFGVDEEDYDNLSANIKNNYWTFLMDGGKSIRIAKPKDLGVLSKKTNDANVTYILNFDEKIGYFREAEKRFEYWYGNIMDEDISDEAKIEKLIDFKKKITAPQSDLKQKYKQIILARANVKAG